MASSQRAGSAGAFDQVTGDIEKTDRQARAVRARVRLDRARASAMPHPGEEDFAAAGKYPRPAADMRCPRLACVPVRHLLTHKCYRQAVGRCV